jgi:hypothetical protein
MKSSLNVVRGPDGSPWAVLGAPTDADTAADTTWSGRWEELNALCAAGRLLPDDAIFCAELSRRWGRLVACTPAFAAMVPSDAACPAGFFLEVLW